jgi:hypothetical protein
MLPGRTMFAPLMDHVSRFEFQTCVARYDGEYNVSRFSCGDQYLCMAFAQLTYRESLRDVDVCLSVFPWARYRSRDAGVKLPAQLDLRGSIPAVVHITEGKASDVAFLDDVLIEPGAIYILDRGYVDFARLHRFTTEAGFFITRWKRKQRVQRWTSHPVDYRAGLISDQTVVCALAKARADYPAPLRRVHYVDPTTRQRLVFMTNHFTLLALTIAHLYKARWQVELFFTWIKQHLRIKAFYGTSENAVKTQIWIALSVYVLVAIVRKRLALDVRLYQLLQVLSLTLFEKMRISTAVFDVGPNVDEADDCNQLQLFDL